MTQSSVSIRAEFELRFATRAAVKQRHSAWDESANVRSDQLVRAIVTGTPNSRAAPSGRFMTIASVSQSLRFRCEIHQGRSESDS
ncbi:hypothetical protein BRAS3843_1100060 [Bradyrhizobium sp. STM 3843]|nr:hypothetical protein BRAS3843_1100060 [Bradyrhizobium sp. STM 3843]